MDENNQMNEQQTDNNSQPNTEPEQQTPNVEQQTASAEQQTPNAGPQVTPNQQMNGGQGAANQYGQYYQQQYGAQGMPNGQYYQQQYGAQGMPNGQYYQQQYGGQGMPNGQYYQQQYGAQGMPNGQYYQQQYRAQGMPNGQMYGQYGTKGTQKPARNIVGDVIEGITGLVTTPYDMIKKLISKGDTAVGCIFIALQSVIAFLLVLFAFLVLGTRSMGISAIGCAFYALFFVLIVDFIAAGMLALFCNMIFKGNLTFGKAANVVGIFAIFQTVANILAVIFVLIGGLLDVHFFISVGYILFVGVTLLAFVFGAVASSIACELNGNIKYYAIGAALIATVLLSVAVDNIGEKVFEDQNVSASIIYDKMATADTVKETHDSRRENYNDYYKNFYDSYGDYLEDYYDYFN